MQIAAREAAAKQLLKDTGIDIQDQLNRMTPAVLYNDPPLDEKGHKLLRNEYRNRLYYFLEISDSDFLNEVSMKND